MINRRKWKKKLKKLKGMNGMYNILKGNLYKTEFITPKEISSFKKLFNKEDFLELRYGFMGNKLYVVNYQELAYQDYLNRMEEAAIKQRPFNEIFDLQLINPTDYKG